MGKIMSSGSSSSGNGDDLPRIGRASTPGPRPVPFWGVCGFLVLFGVHRLAPVQGETAIIVLNSATSIWAATLGVFYLSEATRRTRVWFRARVRTRGRLFIELGTQSDDRDDQPGVP